MKVHYKCFAVDRRSFVEVGIARIDILFYADPCCCTLSWSRVLLIHETNVKAEKGMTIGLTEMLKLGFPKHRILSLHPSLFQSHYLYTHYTTYSRREEERVIRQHSSDREQYYGQNRHCIVINVKSIMTTSYIPQTLVHAHLPCPPTVPNTIPELRIPTERDQADFDPEDGLFHEHALSFSYNSQLNVLARSTHNGYTLELRPLDTVYDPTSINKDVNSSDTIRIIFPERISTLGEGCIILSELDRRVYILVYTEGDVLYRLNFPLAGNKIGKGCRFGFTVRGNEDWVEEWEVPQEIVSAAGGIGCWKAIDELNVMLGCGDGGIVRLSRSTRGINGMSRSDIFTDHRLLDCSSPSSLFEIPVAFPFFLCCLRRASRVPSIIRDG